MRVLVVDDEPLARRRLARMLGRMPGVEVAGQAGDGVEARAAIARLRPDVVLLDIRMPGLDGLALASPPRTCRRSSSRPPTTSTRCGPSRSPRSTIS